jgi:hypothetical protein
MIQHKVFTQSRRTDLIVAKGTFKSDELDLALIEYKRQVRQWGDAVMAGDAIVHMATTGVG